MNKDEAYEKVRKLLTLATKGTGEESRTAAHVAAKLIVEYQLLDDAGAPARTHSELRVISQRLLSAFLDKAWQNRKNKSFLLNVRQAVDEAVQQQVIRSNERAKLEKMLSSLVTRERQRGVLVGVRGRSGGYRLAPNVVRGVA